jgi:hypothetical protein
MHFDNSLFTNDDFTAVWITDKFYDYQSAVVGYATRQIDEDPSANETSYSVHSILTNLNSKAGKVRDKVLFLSKTP